MLHVMNGIRHRSCVVVDYDLMMADHYNITDKLKFEILSKIISQNSRPHKRENETNQFRVVLECFNSQKLIEMNKRIGSKENKDK